MYLVDTSVWIDFLRGNSLPAVQTLKELLEQQAVVGITPLIYQEILQGAADDKDFQKFTVYFGSLPFYHPRDPVNSYREAAKIYFACRRRGITIRSTVDCMIAQSAIEHELILLNNDRDFAAIAKVVNGLTLH